MEAATTTPVEPEEGSPGDIPEPESGKGKRGPHPLSGQYVVLAAPPIPDHSDDEPVGEWAKLWQGKASGQVEAKKLAVAEVDVVRNQAHSENGVWLVALPAASYQPTHVTAEQPEPVLRGL